MSFHHAARRWGVPASAVALLLLPLLVAGCPWDDYPDEFSWWLDMMGFPESCQDCYAEFMEYDDADYGRVAPPTTDDLGMGVPAEGDPAYTVPGGTPGDDDPRDPPPTGGSKVPSAVLRPKIDPELLPNVPQSPNYPKTTPPTTSKKY